MNMKKTKVTETKSSDIKVLRKELADLTMDLNMKKLKDTKVISKKKKEIAQFLTLVRQKEMLAELEVKNDR